MYVCCFQVSGYIKRASMPSHTKRNFKYLIQFVHDIYDTNWKIFNPQYTMFSAYTLFKMNSYFVYLPINNITTRPNSICWTNGKINRLIFFTLKLNETLTLEWTDVIEMGNNNNNNMRQLLTTAIRSIHLFWLLQLYVLNYFDWKLENVEFSCSPIIVIRLALQYWSHLYTCVL